MNVFRRDLSREDKEEKPNFWISYADIMAGLLLMFILLLMVVIFDYKDTLAQKKSEIKKQKVKIEQKQNKIEQMLGVRKDIIEALKTKFENTNLKLEIDSQTGAIRIPGEVFFQIDSVKVSQEGVGNLAKFVPSYIEVLLNDNFRKYLSQIIVEGHTDDQGSYMYNLELSQGRALEVVKQIYKEDFVNEDYKKLLRDYLTANGRSYSQPILNEDGNIDRKRSRRVEFKFILKDEQMIKELQKTLEE
ncbi:MULTISPECIES: OmpA family protein [unclassified Candidatus Frackibacter]|uniref:OmpA family protein n=1 Tax=unclassified Candidatus Frackibacter TaxID=2648818 RepID=UPI0008830D08|nr:MULTISPECIES: OmpA family protein [unclassified Candidatus Frackibacter]SDC85332.1 OmpA family protein [Candidatus Frackibacter sp. WG11]SEM99759.1 OmpA family protein [Candidatus Frackibacter sp. WG12]SFM07821.1 OmpA family protein [Candidatus Frackibacter sp. WG13]